MDWTTAQIRTTFLDFFRDKKHTIVDSAPIVIKDDPTLLFTNAGMNQFKGVFLGNEDFSGNRSANSQKCLRVSGKHNDLEEVGRDHYHHTMFEMLGNWSFGDYFKKDAIDWAWELLVDVYGLDKSRIYVSVFSGDDGLKIGVDKEAIDHWSRHLDTSQILKFGKKENFWEMGDTGPCGPCSEIHFDLRSDEDREKLDGAGLVNADHPEVIEIWNLVFMQYNRLETGELVNLKSRHIDTGMGLERLARVLQNAKSNYDVDLFRNLIVRVEELSGIKYLGGESLRDIAFRVIADHVRAVVFCIADGQLPSNVGAGYVIRRVLRRAIRYGYSQLDLRQPFMNIVARQLVIEMGAQYPELIRTEDLVAKIILEEERSFLQTLSKGLERIEAYIEKYPATNIDAKFAFELYDTFGFPIDLTQLIAAENHVQVDLVGFEKELMAQKERSRSASKLEFGDWTVINEEENSEFVGYDQSSVETHIAKFRKVNLKGKQCYQVVLLKTPFYAESGGQVGDSGVLLVDEKSFVVFDTKKENGEIIHFLNEVLKNMSSAVIAKIDETKRHEISKNHSATHLLHYALRSKLGTHVEQKGSLVNSDKLRFDFSHFEKVSAEDIKSIETMANHLITQNQKLNEWRAMPISEARELGAMALFGEKYGDKVRVVQFGDSIELCGGTHVQNTHDISGVKILSEGGVASGIRRIEAISGKALEDFNAKRLDLLNELEQTLGNPKDVIDTIEKLYLDLKAKSRKIDRLTELEKRNVSSEFEANIQRFNSIRLVNHQINEIDMVVLKDIAHQMASANDDMVVITGGVVDEKPVIVLAISKPLLDRLQMSAGAIIKTIASEINGGGGGQPFLATAGGTKKEGLKRALQHAEEIIRTQVS
jgi:alanyl-tRNA synthetase